MAMMATSGAWVARPGPGPAVGCDCFASPMPEAVPRRSGTGRELTPSVEVCPTQLPGGADRFVEPACDRLEPLVGILRRVLRPYPDVPSAFLGHSLGALIAFELARRVRDEGRGGPIHPFVSGYRAPRAPRPGPPIRGFPDTELQRALRALNGTPEEILRDGEAMDLLLPTLRADVEPRETYRCMTGPSLTCPISAFGGLRGGSRSRRALAAWREQTDAPFALRMLPGDHFFIRANRASPVGAVVGDPAPWLGVEGGRPCR